MNLKDLVSTNMALIHQGWVSEVCEIHEETKQMWKSVIASIVNLTHLGRETSAEDFPSADWHGVISLGIFLIAKLTEEGLGHGERCHP